MNHLQSLGLPAPPAPVLPSSLLPAPASRRVNFKQAPKIRPSESADPVVAMRAAGLITELSTGTVMVDHAARGLATMGLFKHEAKRDLNLLKVQADKLLTAMQSQFDLTDADGANILSEIMGLLVEKACQLKPSQIEALLKHADNMRESNLSYVPATTR